MRKAWVSSNIFSEVGPLGARTDFFFLWSGVVGVPEEEGPLGASGWAPKPCRAVRLDDMFFFLVCTARVHSTPPCQGSPAACSPRAAGLFNKGIFRYLYIYF